MAPSLEITATLLSAAVNSAISAGGTIKQQSALVNGLLRAAIFAASSDADPHVTKVSVPVNIAEESKIMSASLAAQRLAGDIAQKDFHNLGTATKAMRGVLSQDVIHDMNKLRKVRNEAIHGQQGGSRLHSPLSRWADLVKRARTKDDYEIAQLREKQVERKEALLDIQGSTRKLPGQWTTLSVPSVGDFVRVHTDMHSASEVEVFLHKGLLGKILEIDDEGDVHILFPLLEKAGDNFEQWVLRHQFSQISVWRSA
eukprot:TRINITY_DN25604_c0_g1_i6.p1 TRINITY_DN25604_c0_g1~~TRINITY_DN25604_c0_g1_i6.p1  ORF type:complete len:256 (-),score=52.45 TRINITY_DN25604_c0_g1_i6:97-864(-)